MPDTPTRDRPLVIFDGQCGFCRIWIGYWMERTGDRVDYAPYQQVSGEFPQVPVKAFAGSVHLVMPTGELYTGANAVCHLLIYSDRKTWALRCYNSLPGFAPLSEFAYRFIAGHRGFFYRVTVLLFGRRIQPASHHGIEWLFLRLLAAVYFAA